jgi:opacity protein-like surface antigen
MEFALSDRWSARAEYMHYDLGSANFNIDNGFVADAATRGETVRLGASYHFHRPEPVPLK